jgi:hypothetical protein
VEGYMQALLLLSKNWSASDNPEIKASTKMQLRYEIGLKLDMSETQIAKMQRDNIRTQQKGWWIGVNSSTFDSITWA